MELPTLLFVYVSFLQFRALTNRSVSGQIVLLPEPVYRGPEKITYFTGVDNLQKELDKDNRINWIIEFYAAWSPTCINFAPIFSEISAKYTLPNLKFGKVDITRFSEAAEK